MEEEDSAFAAKNMFFKYWGFSLRAANAYLFRLSYPLKQAVVRLLTLT